MELRAKLSQRQFFLCGFFAQRAAATDVAAQRVCVYVRACMHVWLCACEMYYIM